MAKLKVSDISVTPEDKIRFAVECVQKLYAYPKVIRLIKQEFGMSFLDARATYEMGLAEIKKHSYVSSQPTKDIYIEALMDLKGRCEDARDLDNEVRVMRDLGKAMGFIAPINDIETPDEEVEQNKEERLKELLEKYRTEMLDEQ